MTRVVVVLVRIMVADGVSSYGADGVDMHVASCSTICPLCSVRGAVVGRVVVYRVFVGCVVEDGVVIREVSFSKLRRRPVLRLHWASGCEQNGLSCRRLAYSTLFSTLQ